MRVPDAGGGDAADRIIDPLSDALSPAVEDAILALVRELARATPAPRSDPFYGLDRLGGPSLRLLDRLTRHGDFRKYVVALAPAAGLGGAARWLSLKYGCRVVALEASARATAASARLTVRAGLAGRVRAIAGTVDRLPIRADACTQIWSVEALHRARDLHGAVAELFRVLRPGCTLALQEIVARSPSGADVGQCRHRTLDQHRDALATAGFRDVVTEDVTGERVETSSIVLSARERLARVLAARLPASDPWHAATARRARHDALTAGAEYRVLHMFARRPST